MNLHAPYLQHGAKPQLRLGGSDGCLCIHGFAAAPTEITWLADHLHDRLNMTTYTPRLAMHGTDPADMHRAQWEDWYMSARDGYQLLSDVCERVFIAGISMGGLLTLLLNAADDVQPVASAVIAAPLAFKDPLIPWTKYIRLFRRTSYLPDRTTLPQIVREEQQRRGEIIEGRTHYSTWQVNAIDQLYELSQQARAMLYNIDAPLVLVYSEKDTAVPLESSDEIARHVRSKTVVQHTLENSGHIITQDIEREIAFQHIETFFRSQSHANRE